MGTGAVSGRIKTMSCFGRGTLRGRERYYSYVKEGIGQGRRPELVGGRLIRSLGGWAEAKKVRVKGRDRMKGDGEFVMNILFEADERMDRRYELKSLGYDLEKPAQRVGEIYQIEREDLYSKSRQKIQAEARSVFCYWAVRELGVEGTQIAKKLRLSQPGVVYAVSRGGRGLLKRRVFR